MAMDKITAEEKLKDIAEAEALYKKALELIEQGNKLIKRKMRGVDVCSTPEIRASWDSYPNMVEVHLYSGIMKMEKLLNVKGEPKKNYDGTTNKGRRALCIGNVMFFQIGEPTQSEYCYK